MNLEELRTEIDAIDDTLVNAFAQRMDVVARVSQAKKEQGLPTQDPLQPMYPKSPQLSYVFVPHM